MVFIMRVCKNCNNTQPLIQGNRFWLLLLCGWCWSSLVCAGDYHAEVRQAKFVEVGQGFDINADLSFNLSNKAREALHKGVPLNWLVILELQEREGLWHEVVARRELPYQLQYHALLNQYAVQTPRGEQRFLSLNAAMNYMNSLHEQIPYNTLDEDADPPYQLAVKIQFNHDLLPVPLRPFAYIESRWDLSSEWYLWPQE